MLQKDDQEPKLESFRQPIVLPQLMALLASPQFKLKSLNGKFHFGESLKEWAVLAAEGKLFFDDGVVLTKDALQGMFSLLRVTTRSLVIPSTASQISASWIRYANCVPLYLSAFKQFRNIKYSQWDLTDHKLKICTDAKNYQVFESIGKEFNWTIGELIQLRDSIRMFKSGMKAGTMRSLNATYTMTSTEDAEFNQLPSNVKLILLQTWVYQPACATDYGIYNLLDPDAPAIPIADPALFVPCKKDKVLPTITIDPSIYDF